MFTSRRTKRFRALLAALPADAQRQARAAYELFKQNPRHPSLQFKRIRPSDEALYSARVGDHYRAIGLLEGDTVYWTWIGTHEQYNSVTHRRWDTRVPDAISLPGAARAEAALCVRLLSREAAPPARDTRRAGHP